MISIDLRDKNLKENLKSLQELRKTGMFTDEQLNKMYNAQIERDIAEVNENDRA